ncbi:MAG: glycoside hydrolase family 20 zincin-like fold domain-containing protein, partial [Allomuricauda sp.]
MKKILILSSSLLVLLFTGCQQKSTKIFTEADISIIPKPKELQLNPGGFLFTKNTKLVVSDDSQKEVFQSLKDGFKTVAGWDLELTTTAPSSN